MYPIVPTIAPIQTTPITPAMKIMTPESYPTITQINPMVLTELI